MDNKKQRADYKVGVVSLGCDKNRVDSENMLYNIGKTGYTVTNDANEADVVVINTCAFINKSKREAVDTLLEFAALKNERDVKVIATGCLPQRYKDGLYESLPEIDAFMGIADYQKIGDVIDGVLGGSRQFAFSCNDLPTTKRVLTTPNHYAYLKIADGCDNHCTYCAIPSIRGKYRSREIDGLVDETRELCDSYGTREIILVAQDVTRYGIDIYNEYALLKLIEKLSETPISWIRLLYCYPELMTDGLIREIASNPKLCKYVDIPMQHINDRILKLMNRRTNGNNIRGLIDKIRAADENIAIRSSFIVGFPGETEDEFNELCGFIKQYKLNYAGFFTYSKEEGTAAAKLKEQVTEKIKKARLNTVAKIQSSVIFNRNKSYIGRTLKVLYDGIDYDRQMFYGRPDFCAPDIDGKILFTAGRLVEAGEFYEVLITETDGYDLIGVVK